MLYLFMVMSLSIVLVEPVIAELCSSVTAIKFNSSTHALELHPLYVRAYPAFDGVAEATFISFSLNNIIERARSYNSITGQTCNAPGFFLNPLSTNSPYGTILNVMDVHDMECTASTFTDTLAPNVTRTAYRWTFFDDSMPSFVYNLTYSVVDNPYVAILSTNTSNTGGIELTGHYEYVFEQLLHHISAFFSLHFD